MIFLWQIRPTTEQKNKSPRNSELEEHDIQTRFDRNRSPQRHDHIFSVQSNTIPIASSNDIYERKKYNSSNSTDPRYCNYSSKNNTPTLLHRTNVEYFDGEGDETINPPQRPSISQVLKKLSAKTSNTLSIRSNTYSVLETRSSPEFILTRF